MSQQYYNGTNRLILLFVTALLCAGVVNAQPNKISGVVTDADTGEPVPFANVFFAGTSIGVGSDGDGRFVLQNFQNGKYDFTVASVGYEPHQQSLEFNNSSFVLDIKLKIEEVKLREVTIVADTSGRASDLLAFKRFFLGETANASKCRILNPNDIHLYFDEQTRVLVAHASKPLMVENQALGYTIQYYLRKFELNYATGRLEVFGIPMFRDLTPKRAAESKRWERERERAFEGSVTHLIRSLAKDSLEQEGFRVRKFYRVPNPDRPSDDFLNQKIKQFQTQAGSINLLAPGKSDSLRYYLELRKKPRLLDSVATENIRVSDIMSTPYQVAYQGMLRVEFLREREELGYAQSQDRPPVKQQTSVMHFLAPGLKIYENGYYENIYDVFFEWYWAWSEKISDMLPTDYSPKPGKR